MEAAHRTLFPLFLFFVAAMFAFVFAALLVAGALFYAGLLGAFACGFRHVFSAPGSPTPSDDEDAEALPFVSVVIAARDEADSIERCLEAILQSDYPSERFEVIVVDDFSRDATAERVRHFLKTRIAARRKAHRRVPAGAAGDNAAREAETAPTEAPPRLRLLQMHRVMEESTGHKREALNHGISAARGPLILTTDADCTPAPGWIGAMTAPLRSADVAFVAGPVRYRLGAAGDEDGARKSFGARLFDRAQALEFLALQAVGAGSIGLGRPTICNSANVAYRQSVYQALYRPETLGAADDETLIQRIADETDARAAFCAAPDACVETPPADGPRAFWRQRQRWASMTPRYPDTGFTLALGALYGFYVMLLAAAPLSFWMPALLGPLAVAAGLKVAAEAALLVPACRRFDQTELLGALLPFQPAHAAYMVGIGAAGVLGATQWKGRTVD